MALLEEHRHQFVFFDLVGTLVRGTKPIGQQYADWLRRFGVEPDPVRLDAAFHQAMAAAPPMAFPGRSFGEAAALERKWWNGLVRDVVTRAGMTDALSGGTFERFFAALYDHFTTAAAWELYPDVLPALARLRARGSVLGLITNYDTRVFRVLDALDLTRAVLGRRHPRPRRRREAGPRDLRARARRTGRRRGGRAPRGRRHRRRLPRRGGGRPAGGAARSARQIPRRGGGAAHREPRESAPLTCLRRLERRSKARLARTRHGGCRARRTR